MYYLRLISLTNDFNFVFNKFLYQTQNLISRNRKEKIFHYQNSSNYQYFSVKIRLSSGCIILFLGINTHPKFPKPLSKQAISISRARQPEHRDCQSEIRFRRAFEDQSSAPNQFHKCCIRRAIGNYFLYARVYVFFSRDITRSLYILRVLLFIM